MTYKKCGIVCSDMIDANANLSVAGAFRLVENAVTELMGQLRIDGLTVKRLYGAMWVFSKNRVKFLSSLGWGEDFYIESFITNCSPARLTIETAVKNGQDEIAAYAKTELCALDSQTGKIKKTSEVGVDGSVEKMPPLSEIGFAKFGDMPKAFVETVKVRSTDIDFSRHTNNVEYVRFLLDTYSVEELLTRPVKEIEVCYISQSFENDELQIYKSPDGGKDTLLILKHDKQVVKCEILH